MRPPSRDSGLTLIELVVAMSIFALVAVMGLQSLTAMMRTRDRLASIAVESDALSSALSLLRADLDAAVPVLFHPPDAERPRSALAFTSTRDGALLEVSVGGMASFDTAVRRPTRMGRVEWRLDIPSGRLTRREWAMLTPRDSRARSPEMLALDGVQGIALRSYARNVGWTNGVGIANGILIRSEDGDAGPGTNSYTSSLPVAVEVTLTTRAHGTITLVEGLR